MTGYGLDYGDPYSGGTGVTDIETGIDEYHTARVAKRGLALGRRNDVQGVTTLHHGGLAITGQALARPVLGGGGIAFRWTSGIADTEPVAFVDEQWTEGRYLLQTQVAARAPGAATTLARKLAKRLDERLGLALAGRLHANPVKLPPKLKPSPARRPAVRV